MYTFKKPPLKVLSIKGGPLPVDTITQEDLKKGSELQITAWKIEKECQEYMKLLATRENCGAQVEPGDLVWDAENEMVRSRKAKEA